MNNARTFAFGPFLLIPERQLLLHQAVQVRIGCRALDLLTALVERAGQLVTKQELMTLVWPTTVVEESNLKVNIASLRRVLQDDAAVGCYIATIIGRGYRFIAPVQQVAAPCLHWPPVDADEASTDPNRGQGTRVRILDLPSSAIASAIGAPLAAMDFGMVIKENVTLRLGEVSVLLERGSLIVGRGADHDATNPPSGS